MKRMAWTALACLLLAGPVAASDDSVAPMAAGGLVLQRAEGLRLRSQDLYVSAREIRVRYRFFNPAAQPLTTRIAFPLPDITGGQATPLALSDPSQMPFATTVEGRRMATNIEQTAVLAGVDHTGLLRGLELPLSPIDPATEAAIRALPEPQVEMLVDMGLVREEPAPGAAPRFTPLWTLRTVHYWNQVFPAGREIDIDHRYTPATGGSTASGVGDPVAAGRSADYAARYCMDRDFLSAAQRMRTRGQPIAETWIDYSLLAGAEWTGPIGDFRLVVDKGGWRNLISFCAGDVRRTGLSTFEVRRRDFTPDRDLSVLILSSARPST